MTNKKSYDLDLTDVVEPISIKVGDYEATLTGDMALTSMAKMARAFSRIGEAIEGDITLEELGVSEEDMWALVTEVCANSDNPAGTLTVESHKPFTTQAAIKLLTFLAARTNDAVTQDS